MDTKAVDQSAKEAGEAHGLQQQQAKQVEVAAAKLDELVEALLANPTAATHKAVEAQMRKMRDEMHKLGTTENLYMAAAEAHNRIANPTWDDDKHDRVLAEEGKWIDTYDQIYESSRKKAEQALDFFSEDAEESPDSTHVVVNLEEEAARVVEEPGQGRAQQQSALAATDTAQDEPAQTAADAAKGKAEEAARKKRLAEEFLEQERRKQQ